LSDILRWNTEPGAVATALKLVNDIYEFHKAANDRDRNWPAGTVFRDALVECGRYRSRFCNAATS
jgi:hypothetical protein